MPSVVGDRHYIDDLEYYGKFVSHDRHYIVLIQLALKITFSSVQPFLPILLVL